MSIHNFKPGERFCRGRYKTHSGEVDIEDNLLLIAKGSFAYPSYRYLKGETEIRTKERGDEIFGKDKEEVANEILRRCNEKIEKLQVIVSKVEEQKSE